MKTLIFGIALSSIFFVACNNNGTKQKASDGTLETSTTETKSDVAVSNPTNKLLKEYINLKNALAKDDNKGAAAAGNELVKTLDGFDKSSLTAEQAKVFDDIKEDAKEHAEHIGTNAGNIEHQREHFETLSQDMYDLVKVTGAGQKMYYSNCPMYNNNKGANWLSETKEIQNPYLGKAMSTCGSVKEEIN
ncbi:MAG: DUF3347 domain-containing protein [Daejeonella sp.]